MELPGSNTGGKSDNAIIQKRYVLFWKLVRLIQYCFFPRETAIDCNGLPGSRRRPKMQQSSGNFGEKQLFLGKLSIRWLRVRAPSASLG
jgi:hypothetical protein